jgi:hypothetical protein
MSRKQRTTRNNDFGDTGRNENDVEIFQEELD